MSVRDKLLAARVPEEKVKVEGGVVLVRGLTTAGRDLLSTAVQEGGSFRAALLRATCYTTKGKLLFEDGDDIDGIPSADSEPLVDAGVRVAALSTDEVDELEGNSDGAPSGGSDSD